MSVIRWPAPMPEAGRLPEAKRAWDDGKAKVCDPKMECPQTLHISLFFDGTNNNDAPDNPHRDSLTQSQTNVARLFDAAINRNAQGISAFYMPGVGTPFPQIGEADYSTIGKGFAAGYGMRVAWGYTRVLNAIYGAITGKVLLLDDAACNASRALTGDKSVVNNLPNRYTALKAAHKQARDESRRHRTIRKIWINVFGFSRGAAEARSFVSRLINVWAPGGKIANEFDYTVNFLGLFDTVASVGPPDSTRVAVSLNMLDGHWEWTSNGQLNIPNQVRRCAHFFSIHEQRMSFPLDTIRMGSAYPGQEDRLLEVPYPGVHSDVGGGYPPRDQGKAFAGDAFKLSQIPLHDMYIEALRAGVPLQLPDGPDAMTAATKANFKLAPELVGTFNDWLKTAPAISKVEDAMRFGMGQMLGWRTLRARVGTADYVTEQLFFQRAHEGTKSREQVREDAQRLSKNDPKIKHLKSQRLEIVSRMNAASMSATADPFSSLGPTGDLREEMDGYQKELQQNDTAIARAQDANAAKAAGLDPSVAKPGNGPDDLVSDDKTDIQEAAEEFRVLLTWLNPVQAPVWRTKFNHQTNLPYTTREQASKLHRPETSMIYMKAPDVLSRLAAVSPYSIYDDAVIKPRTVLKGFLQQHTSPVAVEALRKTSAAVRLYDDYIHDSRAWFRVPYFREYVPGGYFWARVLFTGGDQRVENLGLG
ncbi:T6SS phospholipase effector Tle1-like catalytic domain-containing protein [Paraburkholderia terricola]|uniref:T6SS phospholipase effector Tle1-like catalytic domain-containing protein n=1 Tax=Paraburkholderia terricola TaxID=169427 RepID=UPI003ECF7E33